MSNKVSSVFVKVREYCEDHGHTLASFERLCHLGNGVVDNWRDNGSEPSLAVLRRMQDATGIPVSEWVKGEDKV